MDCKSYFNLLADKWDSICHHDEAKIREIISLASIKPSSKILDVGTGTGVLIKYLLETNPLYIAAVDISDRMIKVAKSKYADPRVNFICADIFDFFETGFDCAFVYSAYPHFKDKRRLFAHLSALLGAGGKLIIAHSQGRQDINRIHSESEAVKGYILLPAQETAEQMRQFFTVCDVIDSSEMYYVSGVKR